ncbi:hypothetical protein TSUD_131650, partial [Trifolium subterraneum]
IHLEHEIKALIKGVENLYLDDVDGIQNVVYQLNGEGFPLLKHLHVQNNGKMKHIVDSQERNQIHVSFPILETLVLHNLKNLEHICLDPLSITCFGSLSVIKVKNCCQLKYLFSFTLVKELSHLSKIEVCQCNSMKEIVLGDNNSSASTVFRFRSLTLEHLETLQNFFSRSEQKLQELELSTPLFNDQVAFPDLDSLKLSSLNLNKIWNDNNHSMCNLTSLIVESCGELKYLFLSTMVGSFKNLKQLEISNCPLMEEIIAKEERNNEIEEVHFFKLEKITLKDMDNLNTIWHRQFETVKMLQVSNCKKIVVVFPSSMQNTYSKLEMLEVTDCALVEKIFELGFNENSSVENTTHLKIVIDGLPELKNIWSGDLHNILSFQILIFVRLTNCASLEYLLPLSIATRCSHLTKLHIINCENMKEIVAEEKESRASAALTFEFNQLSSLWLGNLDKLKGFYAKEHTVACSSLKDIDVFNCAKLNLYRTLSTRSSDFQDDKLSILTPQPPFIVEEVIPNLEELRINHKEANVILQAQNSSALFTKMKHLRLSSYIIEDATFPYWFLQNVHTLESLLVQWSCFKKIFQDEGQISEKKTYPQLKKLTLHKLHKLQHICEEGFQIDPVLAFLEHLQVAFGSFKHLKLSEYPELKEFWYGQPRQNVFRSLKYLVVHNCDFLSEVFNTVEDLIMSSKYFDMILHSQYSGVQFNKVKYIGVSEFYNEDATFPYWFLKNVPNLETILIGWSSFREIFPGEQLISTEKETQIIPRLKELKCSYLDNLQCICKEGLQMDPILHFLESFNVFRCSSLVKLVPSSVTFNYLTYLEVKECNGMINLITYSTAKSLVKLTTMKIKMCNWLEDIVNGKEEDEMKYKIEFCSLKSLELISLPRLCVFSSCPCLIMFPLLEDVVVKECPRMEYFSLGVTNTIDVQHMKIEEENHWEGDLNRTIKKMFDDKVAFRKFNCLALSDYPELKDLWYGRLNHNVFCNLKSLVVQKCDFLSHVLLPSNVMQALHGLEELKVTDCDSLEAVFDVKAMKSRELFIKQSTQLKRLTLSSLPKLKHIWNEDPHEIISFGNLCKVEVSMCQSLLYIFPLSLSQDLGYLEILDIQSCGVDEIVEMEEGSVEISFNFPQLNTLVLYLLTNLETFYRGKHALECPSLKIFNVYRCEALRMFSFNHLDFQQPNGVGGNPTIPQQALFSIEKLSPNLEELAIICPDAMEILNEENVFHKVEFLRLQCFDETPTIFLNDFFTAFPHLKTFQVRNSSFETLFPTKATISHRSLQISNQIRTLFLYELENLKHIWQEDFPLDHPLLQDLEILSARNCPSLINLVPSSTSFTNLTYLEVDNCKELIYLITSSTAKSLVQLTTLIIRNCEKMLDVVKIDEEKAEENIVFENLECLGLSSLPSFRSFCYGKQAFIFPSFLRFFLEGCPQMKIFSSGVTVAPCLRVIFVEEGKMRWKGDLNTTIEQLFIEQEVPHSNVE